MAAEVRTLRLEMASLDDATATMRNQADALRKECADEKSRRASFYEVLTRNCDWLSSGPRQPPAADVYSGNGPFCKTCDYAPGAHDGLGRCPKR